MIDKNSTPYQLSNYQIEQLEGEVVLLHNSGLKVMHSNQTGAMIWQMCDGQKSVAEIIDLLAQAYPEASKTIPQDVKNTLQILAQHGAIGWL